MKVDLAGVVVLDDEHARAEVRLDAMIDGAGQRGMVGVVKNGRVGQCRFVALRIEVTERLDCGGWLAVSLTRRVAEWGPWQDLSAGAESVLRATIDKATADLSFHDAWFTSFHQVNAIHLYDEAGKAMRQAEWERTWWARSHVIASMMQAGQITAELPDDRDMRVQCPTTRRSTYTTERVGVLLLLRRFDTSELVGYLTRDGRVAPVMRELVHS